MKIYNAFVLMPFDKSFDDIFKLGIQDTARECNVNATRLDDQLYDSNMVQEIYKQIQNADFIIADMSTRNPNVFYEVGYADARKKLVILLTKSKDDIPFDFLQRPHIIYGSSIAKLKTELKEKIEWAKKESAKRNNEKIDISLSILSSSVYRTEYSDTANVNFRLEISNFSDEPDAMIFLTEVIL